MERFVRFNIIQAIRNLKTSLVCDTTQRTSRQEEKVPGICHGNIVLYDIFYDFSLANLHADIHRKEMRIDK